MHSHDARQTVTNELAFLLDRVPAVTSEMQVDDRLITELNLTLAKKANKYAWTADEHRTAGALLHGLVHN